MGTTPTIRASVTFLPPEAGGRSQSAWDSPSYRPHLVVGDPDQRTVLRGADGSSSEDYLGVQFTGQGIELPPGVTHQVKLNLVYSPRVDYSALTAGATFTIREGSRVVGHGRVLRWLRD